jgi:hypothetical protein
VYLPPYFFGREFAAVAIVLMEMDDLRRDFL